MRVFGIAILLFIGVVVLAVVGRACNWVGQAADVVSEEVAPHELLRKYTWFKTAAAELDAKRVNIEASKGKRAALAKNYEGVKRGKWAREDREQDSLWATEVAGLVANYNGLAAEYNAAMAKINWKFCNVGDLPPGATVALPREFRAYTTGEDQ